MNNLTIVSVNFINRNVLRNLIETDKEANLNMEIFVNMFPSREKPSGK